jgi:hypothetical protein
LLQKFNWRRQIKDQNDLPSASLITSVTISIHLLQHILFTFSTTFCKTGPANTYIITQQISETGLNW